MVSIIITEFTLWKPGLYLLLHMRRTAERRLRECHEAVIHYEYTVSPGNRILYINKAMEAK